jgi:hypothetical protein
VLSSEVLLKGVAAPLLVAFAATLVSMRLSAGRRGVGAIGLIAGQVLGTALAVWGQADWFPDRNLEWVPWVTVGAAIVGPMVVAMGLASVERWLLTALASLAAAALIVPPWPDLWPSRPYSMLAVVGSFLLLARGVDGIARRTPPRLLAIAIACTALLAPMLIAALVSLKLSEAALVTAASLVGALAALFIRPDESAVRGLALPYAIAVGGWCYVSAIELPPPEPPVIELLVAPLAPLILWLVSVGPLAAKSLRLRWAIGLVLVLGYLAAIGTWTLSGLELPE